MKIVSGDLLEKALGEEFDVIIHGCNCFCDMGAGIAKQIKEKFPDAYNADLKTKKGDKSKLGTVSTAKIHKAGRVLTIVNGYTQFADEGQGILVDYDALRSVMKAVKEQFSGQKIGYPKIGAGLAKGDWDIISMIIDKELEGEDHTCVEYNKR